MKSHKMTSQPRLLEIFVSVRPVRPSVRPSVRLSVLSVRPSVRRAKSSFCGGILRIRKWRLG